MAFQTYLAPWIRGYDLGVGIDMPSGARMARCVEPDADGVEDAAGASGEFTVSRITDSSSLQKSLGIDVEASYGAGAFGAGVSARLNFAQNQSIDEQSLFMSVIMKVELGFLSIDAPRLTTAAAAAANDAGLFQARYGDMFVSGLARGGLFTAVMHFHTRNSEEAQSISTQLEGSYGLFSAEASVRLENVQKNFNTELTISVYHEGGPVDLITVDKLEDPQQMLGLLQRFAQSFVDDPGKASVPYTVSISPIQIAEGPVMPNAQEIQHAADVLLLCARRRDALMDAIAKLTYVQDHPDRYDPAAGAEPAAVATALEGAQADLDLVADCAAAALRDRAHAATPEEYAKAREVVYPAYRALDPAPKPIDIANGTVVPDFSICTSWDMCEGLAAGASVALREAKGGASAPAWSYVSSEPPAGAAVPVGQVVTITTAPIASGEGGIKADFSKFRFDAVAPALATHIKANDLYSLIDGD